MRRAYPSGPKINVAMAMIAQLFPKQFPFDPLTFNLTLGRDYGDIAYYHVGPLKVYQLNHPDLARQILVEEPEKFYKPRLLKRGFRPFGGNGLLTSDGDLWKRQRKLIQPAFQHQRLGMYARIMVDYAERVADAWRPGEVIDIGAEMMKVTLGIVVKSLFGGDVSGEAEEVGHLMMAVLDAANHRINTAFGVPDWVPTSRHRRERRALRRLDEILRAYIDARRAAPDEQQDLLSTLLAAVDEESGTRMSDRQLRDEMMTLFLAGHETTANALTWTWYLLSQHPNVERRLHDEIDEIDEIDGIGGIDRAADRRVPTAEDLPRLPFGEMVIRESMRLYPPAPGFTREPIEDVRIGGFEVPKGSLVTVITYALHRDKRFFEDPETFNPDRFGPGWLDRIPRYAYLPFGGGPRVCIGNGFAMMEARLVLAAIARRYRLTLEPGQDVKPVQLITVRPKDPIRMRVVPRDIARSPGNRVS